MSEEDTGELLSVEDSKTPGFRWTVKKEKFCYHMARMGVVSEAEKAAGYSPGGAIPAMVQQPIRDRIQKEVRALLRSAGENEDTVIARWAMWADADIGDYFEPGWILKDVTELNEDQRKCIKKVKITHGREGERNIDFELHDQSAANVHLANMFGLLSKDGEGSRTPEETAKSIKQILQEMDEVNGLTKPELESGAGRTPKVTH